MKNTIFRFIIVSTILLGSLSAQSFVGKLNPSPVLNLKTSSDDTLKVLAVMVDFRADEDDATFGDGTFGSIYSKEYGNDIIDPLPHDADYFGDHLEFAKNYFAKVSNNNLVVSYKVLENIVTVDNVMREYAPSPNDVSDFSPLAQFAEEVWTKADIANPDLNFVEYDLFTIFHAGVGRDIDVPGSIGNDRDLPSVYLSIKALKNAIDESFDGFAVQDGSFKITNTMILPETESRELESFGTVTLLELSINGLLVASIASHLGLPDLFNTETGLSSIGRFGLMDGQSIFTFGGLFPPEPSPWEKIYLGWLEPTIISPNNTAINLVAEEISTASDTSIIKIPINANEYYLVENRSRDAKRDGATVTYKVGGEIKTISFDRDYDSFISFNVDTISGVVIDVDEFDWAVPAFDRDDSDLDAFTDVGIVIWHIDDNIINQKLETNTINNDKFLRGVRVVEADGIDDIGEEFQTIFGDYVIGEGSKEDTWYNGNPSELYRNRFNSTSSPASKSNSGANSLISLTDFSEIGVSMSFNLSFGSGLTNLATTFMVEPNNGEIKWVDAVSNQSGTSFIFANENRLSVTDVSGDNIFSRNINISYKPAAVLLGDELIIISSNDRSIEASRISETTSSLDSVAITTSPVISSVTDKVEFYLGNNLGFVNLYELKNELPITINGIKANKAFDDAVIQIASDGEFVSAISNSAYWDSQSGRVALIVNPLQLAIAKMDGAYYSIVLLSNNSLKIYKNGNVVASVEFTVSDFAVKKFSLGDLKSNGSANIVVNHPFGIYIYNLQGAMVQKIPYELDDVMSFDKVPLLIDLNDDNLVDIFSFSSSGKVNAFSGLSGKLISPYPISYSGSATANPLVVNSNDQTNLLIIDKSNFTSVWNIGSASTKIDWGNVYGNSFNTSLGNESGTNNQITIFFPKSEAYNWPNPVYDNTTYFHFYVAEDSDIEINIFDLAGDRVDKLSKNVAGGFENEISWDVTNIESGVYLAHLNVKSVKGNSDYKIIKVAVIK